MEKHQITAEQAVNIIMGLLDTIELKGHANIKAMSQSMDLLAKIKDYVHVDPEPAPAEPVVTLTPVDGPDPDHN